jgi:uncharacterized membrane protein YfcA
MNIPDLINGLFEASGSFFIMLSILKLHKDKQVHGVSWIHAGFFAAWGYWNLFYYPHLSQWISFMGGIGIVVTNTYWLGQLVYYSQKDK